MPTPLVSSRPASRNVKKGGQASHSVPQLASLSGQQTPELTIQDMLRVVKREVERSPILDLLMEGVGGVKVVLTVSRALLSPEVEAYLIGGRFKAIGKVSAVLDETQSISLLRRTVFGFGGRELANEMFGSFNESMADSGLALAQTFIDGPVIQVLPLAIYL